MHTATRITLAVGSFYLVYRGFSAVLESYIRRRCTLLNELDELGTPRKDGDKIRGTVVIAGGSLAGLWTARVCSDHFDRVVVIDPEAWLCTEEGVQYERPTAKIVGEDKLRAPVNKRARVLQYHSLHIFQVYGLLALRKCFAGFDDKYESAGGLLRSRSMHLYFAGFTAAPFDDLQPESVKRVHWCNRSFIEPLLRELVKSTCPNVHFIVGTITGFTRDPQDQSRILAASFKHKDTDIIVQETATLFVDCAGPTHQGLQWLREAGYGEFENNNRNSSRRLSLKDLIISYQPRVNYSSSYWPVDAKQKQELEAIIPGGFESQSGYYAYISNPSESTKACGFSRFDKNQVTILCGSRGSVELPRSAEEISEFFSEMKGFKPVDPWVFVALEVIFRSKDEAIFDNIRVPQCTRVQYDKAANLPLNYVAIGDANAMISPPYGQGHSKCIMGAAVLNSLLRKVPSNIRTLPQQFGYQFFRIHEQKIGEPLWVVTKGGDYKYTSTTTPVEGETMTGNTFMGWYTGKLGIIGQKDAEVSKTMNDVSHFIAPGLAVFKPSLVGKVLWATITRTA